MANHTCNFVRRLGGKLDPLVLSFLRMKIVLKAVVLV